MIAEMKRSITRGRFAKMPDHALSPRLHVSSARR
jgi:hypothetical protein